MEGARSNDPLRGPQSSLNVNNSEDWTTIFSALVSSKQNRGEVRIHVPETILISTNGVASSWYFTSTNGMLKGRAQRHINYRAIDERFRELPNQWCILRHGFSSRVLDPAAFASTLQRLQRFSNDPSYRESNERQQMPFCLQQFIEPAHNSRYVTTFMPVRTCHTFRLDYSSRYTLWQTHDHEGGASVSSNNEIDENLILERCKRNTMALVNWINKGQGTMSKTSLDRKTRKLNGLVVEYIVGKDDGELYLNAILGTLWQGDGQGRHSSWQGIDNIAEPALQRKIMSMTAASREKVTTRTQRGTPKLANNLLPDISGQIAVGPRPNTVGGKPVSSRTGGLLTGQTRPSTSPAKGSSGLGERKPGFVINRPALVVELSQQLEVFKEKLQQLTERSLEAEDAERVQTERAQTLAQHNEQLQTKLSDQTQDGMAQEAHLLRRVATLREERQALQQAFERRNTALQVSRKHVSELRQTLTKERAVAFDLLGDLQHKAEALESELAAQTAKQQELDALRSAKTATLSSETQVNSDLRRDLMLKNQHVESLQQEIAECKIQGAALRQQNVILNRFLPIRDVGGRFTHGQESEDKKGGPDSNALSPAPAGAGSMEGDPGVELRSVKLDLNDILHQMECYNSYPAAELELLRQIIAQFNTLLRLIFKFYKGQLKQGVAPGNGSGRTSTANSADFATAAVAAQKRRFSVTVHGANKSLSMAEFMRFVDDCGLVSSDVSEELTMTKLNEILVAVGVGTATSLSRGGKATWTVSYQHFCEVLVRIGIAKNAHRFAADRFAKLVEKEVLPAMDNKIYQLMDEL